MHIIYLTIYDLFHFISYKLLILYCLFIIIRKLGRYVVVENKDNSRKIAWNVFRWREIIKYEWKRLYDT